MNRVTATYIRVVELPSGADALQAIELTGEVWQDSGTGFSSELLIFWSPETLARVARLDADEQVGAVEAIEDEYWEREAEECRVASVRQYLGEIARAS